MVIGDFVKVTRINDNGGVRVVGVTKGQPMWGRIYWVGEQVDGAYVEWADPRGVDTDFITRTEDRFEIAEPPDDVLAAWAARSLAGAFQH